MGDAIRPVKINGQMAASMWYEGDKVVIYVRPTGNADESLEAVTNDGVTVGLVGGEDGMEMEAGEWYEVEGVLTRTEPWPVIEVIRIEAKNDINFAALAQEIEEEEEARMEAVLRLG